MFKALKKYKGKKWRECGFKPAKKDSLRFNEWLYWQSEEVIKKALGRRKAKLFIMLKGKLNLFINEDGGNE
jgi:hypothetical protein